MLYFALIIFGAGLIPQGLTFANSLADRVVAAPPKIVRYGNACRLRAEEGHTES